MGALTGAEAVREIPNQRRFIVKQGGKEHTEAQEKVALGTAKYSLADTTTVRKYSKAVRDESEKIIRGYEGVDFKAVYAAKPLAYKIIKRKVILF